jgi:methylated-DNA-[protein]-cysteine S-methyltransferase
VSVFRQALFDGAIYTMKNTTKSCWAVSFNSSIGWFAVLGETDRIKAVTFGHPSATAAKKALPSPTASHARVLRTMPPVARRLQAYARGKKDDFCDVSIDLGQVSAFKRKVLDLCRKIPFGATLNYGKLAALAGSPKAARAVGSCMSRNRLPIIIPCHRVVRANGSIGAYTACGGSRMKKRLLDLEKLAAKQGVTEFPR